MAACGVTKFTESTQLPVSGLEDEDPQDSRKRKRMISNRESARRSRTRKKELANDLVVRVSQLVSDNKYMAINLKDTTQMFLKLESENSVLRAQLAELTHRFESLTEIVNGVSSLSDDHANESPIMCGVDDEFLIHCYDMFYDNQHSMVDMFLN